MYIQFVNLKISRNDLISTLALHIYKKLPTVYSVMQGSPNCFTFQMNPFKEIKKARAPFNKITQKTTIKNT